MTALKPCPFCGSSDVDWLSFTSAPDEWWLECNACRMQTDAAPTQEQASKAWNTRAPLATDEELRELQRRAAAAYVDPRFYARMPRWQEYAVVRQRRAATLSALERRLRGAE